MRARRTDRGASALEMSIVVPVFLLVIFSIVEVGLWLFARNVAVTAAHEGASVMRISGTLDEPEEFRAIAVQTAERYADELGILTGAEATVSGVEDGRVTVSVSGGYVDLVPFFPATVTETVSVEVELFEPDTGELS